MERLLIDFSVRRGAQVLLLSAVFGLLALEAAFVIIVQIHYQDRIEDLGLQSFQTALFSVLSFPFTTELGSLATTSAAIFPLIVSAVCYQVDTKAVPPKATSVLNRTGHVCLLVLTIGIITGLVNVYLSIRASSDIAQIVGEDKRAAIRDLFSVLMSFQLFYAMSLIGVHK